MVKIIRVFWNDLGGWIPLDNIPDTPQYDETVFVWGEENLQEFINRGYDAILIRSDRGPGQMFNTSGTMFGRKLVAIDKGLMKFDEVLFLDWDCNFVKPMDENFRSMLDEKKTQIPIYSHNVPDPWNSSFKLEENVYLSSNAGFIYSRTPTLCQPLIHSALTKKIAPMVEEWSWNLYSNIANDIDSYIDNYLPRFGYGVSKDAIEPTHENYERQKKAWDYVDSKVTMDVYLKHT